MHEDEIEQILFIALKISILQMDVKKDQQALEKLMSAKTLKELESIDKKDV